MFSHVAALLAVVVAVAASARMDRRMHFRRDNVASQCNTGAIKCCNSVSNATNLAPILDILSLSYSPSDSIGIDCTPFNIYGAGEAATCQQQPVCCSGNNFTGAINVGCSPIDFN